MLVDVVLKLTGELPHHKGPIGSSEFGKRQIDQLPKGSKYPPKSNSVHSTVTQSINQAASICRHL